MLSTAVTAVLVALAVPALANPIGFKRDIAASEYHPVGQVYPGQYETLATMGQCPPLIRRPVPANARDVRPDDITTIMASGDSLTAAFFAKSQRPTQIFEYRGVSYVTGQDAGAITLANMFGHYTPLVGGSKGKQLATICVTEGLCTPQLNSGVAGLNAAISGALAGNFEFEATSDMGKGDAESYASEIKDAVEKVRAVVPKLIVNVISNIHVSEIYNKTFSDPYCKQNALFKNLPHFSIECSCAWLPGPAGDEKRTKMDELVADYDAALKTVVNGWNAENNPNFAAVWQPCRPVLSIRDAPIQGLSPADCFHPSELGHQGIAAALWNRMVFKLDQKSEMTAWDNGFPLRCLEENDRFQIEHVP